MVLRTRAPAFRISLIYTYISISRYHFALPPQEGQGLNVYVNDGLNVLRRRHRTDDELRSLVIGANLVEREREMENLVRKLFHLHRDTCVLKTRPNTHVRARGQIMYFETVNCKSEQIYYVLISGIIYYKTSKF